MKRIFTVIISVILVFTLFSIYPASTISADVTLTYSGDLNGDDRANSADLLILKKHILSVSVLTGNALSAANIDNKNDVNSADLLLLRRSILGVAKIYNSNVTINDSINSLRYLGRTYLQDNVLFADNTGSGFEVGMICKGNVFLTVGWSWNSGKIAVVIDDDEANARQIKTTYGEREIEIASNLTAGYHKIKVIKLTEAYHAQATFKSLRFDGKLSTKPAEKPLKFEVYGDSITAGLWNETTDRNRSGLEQGDYQDGNNTYAAVAAKQLNADLSTMAISGWGLLRGYGNYPDSNIPKVWDCVLPKTNQAIKWDFSKYQADVVIVNLGTNDSSVYQSTSMPTKPEFQQRAQWFLTQIRAKHPNSFIIWANGLMGEGSFVNEIKAAISATGDSKISYFKMSLDNYGGDWHPTMNGHKIAGNELAAEIRRLLNI